ncbi:hypothetical protein CDAR_218261 [Caerostris darwini]|uniref:Uncharacterized protein n=1 Tax=Caerostris darwini TaxID=1538125 RepID=A0AAV4RAL0_9ARAC|nr:hypothetical protein CDAR_218261 [Caerostris darwini]
MRFPSTGINRAIEEIWNTISAECHLFLEQCLSRKALVFAHAPWSVVSFDMLLNNDESVTLRRDSEAENNCHARLGMIKIWPTLCYWEVPNLWMRECFIILHCANRISVNLLIGDC